MTESCPKKTNIAEISPHLICALCGGYLIDATTIVECLHSFCKTCIVRYLESSKYCPICEVLVHKTRPLQNIRLDHTLQDIVYKLVPGLFQSEMKRRREFYKDHPTVRSAKVRQEQQRHRVIYSGDEQFSISLEFCPNGRIRRPSSGRKSRRLSSKTEVPERRYFLVPANTTVALLKKFMKLKFALPQKFMVDIFHSKGPLREHYSMMDVAYIYSWKREGVLQLYYSVYKAPDPVPEIRITEVKDEMCLDVADDTRQRIDDSTRPSVLFNKATLLGNHSVDRNIPHDLSPLELIATVANDICIQEGRGLKQEGSGIKQEVRGQKRKTDDAQLYENDDDNNSTETRQIQKSIERAIDLCSNSRNGSPACSTSASGTTSATSTHDTRIDKTVTELGHVPITSGNKVKASASENSSVFSMAISAPAHDQTKGTLKVSDKTSVTKDKPKKTDTASQCDPRPKKHKGEGHVHNKSKTNSKLHNANKETKETTEVESVDKKTSVTSEARVSGISTPSKANGTHVTETNGNVVNNNNNNNKSKGGTNMDVNKAKTSLTTKEINMKSETLKDQKSPKKDPAIPKEQGSLKSDGDKKETICSINSTTQVTAGSTNSVTMLNRPLNIVTKGSYSPQPMKSSISIVKAPSSAQQTTKVSSTQSTVSYSSTHVKGQTKVTTAQVPIVPNKMSGPSVKPSTTTVSSKTIDSVKSSPQINGHSSPSETANQQNKNSTIVKVTPTETKTTKS